MPLKSAKSILDHARRERYAVGAFVCMNLEMISAAVEAAEEMQSPVIIRIHPDVRLKTPLKLISEIVRYFASETAVPICISLDHGATTSDVLDAIAAGFSSVMMDAGEETLEKNAELVRLVTAVAQPLGVLTEAALGHMPHGQRQSSTDFVKIDEAKWLI